MPELPEVERGRRLAEHVLTGKTITRAKVASDEIVIPSPGPKALARALRGRRIQSVKRWGKQLWFELDRPPHPLWHFGMTGGFHSQGEQALRLKAGPNVSAQTWPPRFLKVLLILDDGSEFAFCDARRLGRVLIRKAPTEEPPIARLGFDALLAMPSPAVFVQQLAGRRTIIKSLLLDQKFCAGVGNWIADEVLYQAGIDPRRRACDLDPVEARRLRSKLNSIVRRAVQSDADDDKYPATWLFHRRWGRQADQSITGKGRIEFLTIGGRTTAWVPDWQK